MLSLYGSFTVPNVPHVVVYRDDEEPLKFYMVSNKQRILRASPADGNEPMIELIAYLRDLDNVDVDDDNLERGHMQLTVGLEVTQQDQKRIRNFLRDRIRRESRRGYRFLRRLVRLGEPILSYAPLFVGGTAEATTFDEDLQSSADGASPILNTGPNSASFSYSLTQSGARFMKQALEDGVLPVRIQYNNHMLVARIPAIKIRIHGDRREFMREVERNAVTRTFSQTVQHKTIVGNTAMSSISTQKKTITFPPTLSLFRSTYQSLKIEIDDGDFRDADPDDNVAAELERLAFTVLENNILPTFFDPAIQSDEADDGEKEYWIKTETVTGKIDVTIQRRDVVQIAHNPSGMIGDSLSEQEVKDAVTLIDTSQPIQPVHRLNVHPNINFETDPIFAVRVLVNYREMDDFKDPPELISVNKDFMFQKGTTSHHHKFKLARTAEGEPKTTYRYRTTMIPKNMQGEVQFPSNDGWVNTSVENLVVSYSQFGHVKIDFVLGALPDEVLAVEATVTYPGSNIPGATQTLHLSREMPTSSYLHSTQSDEPIRPYKLRLVYVMDDGSKIELPETESNALVQTITSPFEDRLETTFIARGNFETELSSILVTAKYEDAENDLEEQTTFQLDSATRSDIWSVRQIDKTHDDFTYTVRVARQDGSDTVTQHSGVLGDVITVGPKGSDAIEVMVDAGLVDWNTFARVLVTVDYLDEENEVHHNKLFRFAPMSPELETWTILIADPAKRNLTVTKRFIGNDPADSITGEPEVTADPFILLR